MFRRGIILLCLLVSSLAVATTVHAREIGGAADIECSGYVHAHDGAEQPQGDPGKTVPHHHGCHGAAVFLPAKAISPAQVTFTRAASPLPEMEALGRWVSGPDLRPPIA